MKKIYILIIAFLCNINAFSQDCEGITCVANPNVMQDKTVICYQEPLDSNSWCTPITNECYQVCENTYSTYSTTYNVGSTYSWIVTGGQLITTNTTGNIISVLWGPQGVGDVTVEESDTTGCSKIASACIDIITTPIASITNIPNTSTICQNTNIQFFGENLNSSTNPTSVQNDSCSNTQQPNWDSTGVYGYDLVYLWDFGDGNTSLDQNPYHSYNNPGTYLVSLIIANSCQCADTVTLTIQVVNTLGPEITTTCIGTVCEGDTIEYCTNASSPSWSVEGGVLYNSVITDNCINVIWDNFDNELNDGLGSVFLADLSSTCGSSSSIMNVPAVPSNPIITGNINPCDNSVERYSFACIPGVDYNWQLIGAPWGVAIVDGWGTSEIIIENQWAWGVSYQLELTISSSTLDCSFNITTLNIDVLPDLSLYGNTTVCENGVTTYYTSSGNSEEWEVINGTIQSPAGPPYIDSQIDVIWDQGYGTGIVKISPINTGVYCNDQATLSVDIIESPQEPIDIINDVLGDTLVCPGETYLYTVDPTNTMSSVNASYSWTVTGGTPSSANGDNCVITWGATGPYSIDVVNVTSGWPTCESNTFSKVINSLSIASPVISGNSVVCINDRSDFKITNVYPNDVNITWSVANPNLGSVVSGQGTNDATIEWGNQLGSTDITVIVEICGTTVTNTFSVTLIGVSVSFTSPNTVICPQSNVTFTASSNIGDFTWDFGDGNTTTITNSGVVNHSYAKPGEYQVQLTLVDANECKSIASGLIEVSGPVGHINPKPNTGNTLKYCDGPSYLENLTVTTASNANPSSWEWYHNGVLVQNGGSSYSPNLTPPLYNESGTYHVVLTDINGCSNTTDNLNLNIINCTPGGGGGNGGGSGGPTANNPIPHVFNCNSNLGTWDITFTSPSGSPANFYTIGLGSVFNTTTASFTASEAGTYRVFCYDLSGNQIGSENIDVPFVVDWKSYAYCDAANNNQITMHFRDTTSYLLGISGITYHWDFGDGTTSNLQNPSHTYTVPGLYTVDFTVSYGGLTCNKSQQVEAEFNAAFSYSGPLCEQTPTISFVSSNVQVSSWLWDFNDGSTSARENPERTYDQPGFYNPSLSAISVDGCVDFVSVPLQIYSKPIINSISSVNALCSNDPQVDLSTLVSYSNSNGETAIWSGVGVDYSSGNYYFNPLLAGGGTHEVCITVTNNDGCFETQCINIIVICPEKPRIFGESDYCYDPNSWNGQSLQTQNGFTDYIWYKDNTLHQGPFNWAGVNFYETVGSYDITVSFIDDNGCTGTSEVFVLNIHPTPNQVSVSSNGICPGTQITLTHNGGQANVDYYWNTIPQQTGNSVDVIAEDNYTYQVIGVNQFGCESTSWNWIDIPNKIEMCNILSGCFCDSTILNSNNLIEVSGNIIGAISSYEWLTNGSSFSPLQVSSPLIIDPLDPNYLNLISGNINLSVRDWYGCTYESNDLFIETNCLSCVSAVTDFYVDTFICTGESYVVGSSTYSISGNYVDALVAQGGCDSIVHTNLSVLANPVDTQDVLICDGDNLVVGSSVYSTPGFYSDIFIASNGCDSTLYTNLSILPISTHTIDPYVCSGDTFYSSLGNIYTQNGVYTDTLVSANGCDSIITANLTVSPLSYNSLNPFLCDGEDTIVGNSVYSSTGLYYDTLMNADGCDSIITTDLTVYPSYYNQQLFQACLGDSISVGNNYYSSSGIYTDSMQTINGCDSILLTQIIIEDPIVQLTASAPYLYLNIVNGTLPFSYTIGNQNGPLITSSNNIGSIFTFNPIINGTYYVVVTDSVGCISDTMFIEVNFVPNSTSLIDIDDLVVYPNPSKGLVNIQFTSTAIKDINIRVTNLLGEVMFEDELIHFKGSYKTNIDLANQPKGIYLLEIETNTGRVNNKLIIY